MTLEPSRSASATPAIPAPATIVALHVCPGPRSRSVLEPVPRVTAIPGQGLEGDRHARPGSRRQVLLVEQEVLDSRIAAADAVVTTGRGSAPAPRCSRSPARATRASAWTRFARA